MNMYQLSAPGFTLQIYNIILYNGAPTDMNISVVCGGYAGGMQMEIFDSQLCSFAVSLKAMYDDLKGTVEIKEAFGDQAYIRFACDHWGHITISGELFEGENYLKFSANIDQTYLKDFSEKLYDSYGKGA